MAVTETTTFSSIPLLPDTSGRDAGHYKLLAVLQVMDVATTWAILSFYSARSEANPVIASVIESAGLHAAMLAILVLKLAVVWVLYEKQTGVKLMSALYSLVVFNNLLFVALWIFT